MVHPSPGMTLSDRYLLQEVIGSGGMGTVWRATDLRTDGMVAVKIPHRSLARNQRFISRLQREARIAKSLRPEYWPYVVRVTDFNKHGDIFYIVMEYVPGKTLADELQSRKQIDWRETLDIIRELGYALYAMNQVGIIHRDLKPENIKIILGDVTVGRKISVKVLDFGIAKLENEVESTTFVHTPAYCAPERANGQCDIRSDLYSLGIIMYEMLTGAVPFSGSPAEVIRKHEAEKPPPLAGNIPPEVASIVMRCLEKSAGARYQTPKELLTALGSVILEERNTAHGGKFVFAGSIGGIIVLSVAAVWLGLPGSKGPEDLGSSALGATASASVPTLATPALPVVTGLRVLASVFDQPPHAEEFVAAESIDACFGLTASGDDVPLEIAVTAGEHQPENAQDQAIVARSQPIPQEPEPPRTDSLVCETVRAVKPPLDPGAYTAWVLHRTSILARANFRLLPTPTQTATPLPPTAASTPAPPPASLPTRTLTVSPTVPPRASSPSATPSPTPSPVPSPSEEVPSRTAAPTASPQQPTPTIVPRTPTIVPRTPTIVPRSQTVTSYINDNRIDFGGEVD